MLVTTATSASMMLTASSRPPRPTSRIVTSGAARAKSQSAARVPYSKYVSATPSRTSSTALNAVTRSSSPTYFAADAHALVVTQEVR